jgi:hypothetical protein
LSSINNEAVIKPSGAMATARSGHASETFRHAHATPWAWHPFIHPDTFRSHLDCVAEVLEVTAGMAGGLLVDPAGLVK